MDIHIFILESVRIAADAYKYGQFVSAMSVAAVLFSIFGIMVCLAYIVHRSTK